jgi:hypothetical protein
MEIIREQGVDNVKPNLNLKERLNKLEHDAKYKSLEDETAKEQKPWKFPWRWSRAISKANSTKEDNKILVFYLNLKGEIESPTLLPYRDNIIIYKNRIYEFDPRAIVTVKQGRKIVKALFIREIDRRPISNLDYSEVRARGDATDSDELLIKAAASLVLEKDLKKKPVNYTMLIIIGVIILGGIIFFMSRK